uniref:Reverse transcriptase domain-containing protein n=1 Tax=Fagus sylvatica TaxID=28930 RepID=A0A2N9G8S6_FAGSY
MRGGRVGFIENRARLAQHHHARRMTVLRELWYCHVAVLSFHASSPSNPPRFPCAYPFLSDFRGQFWRSSGTQNGSCGISSESSRRPLSNDIKFARIGVRTRELWLPEVGVSELFLCTFPMRIPVKRGMLSANREFHVVAGVIIFPTHPGSRINLLRAGKTLRAKAAVREKKCVLLPARFFSNLVPVPDSRESELGLVRYGPASRVHRGVFGPFEGSFPIGIPADPDKFLAIREFHVVHGCVLLSNVPGLADQLVASQEDSVRKRGNVGEENPGTFSKTLFCRPVFTRVALHRGEFGFARYDLANGGRRNVPYAKGGGQFDPVFGLVNGPVKPWSNLVNLGQTWSNLVKALQTLGECIPDYISRVSGHGRLGSGCLVLRADTRENPGGKNGVMTPPRFVTPEFEIFYENGDPEVHLQKYGEKMALHLENELLMISVFPESLSKQAAAWFYQLRNLTGWDDLAREDEEPYIIPDPGVSEVIVEIKEELDMSSLLALTEGEEEEKAKLLPPAKDPDSITIAEEGEEPIKMPPPSNIITTTTAEEEYAGPMAEGLSIHTITEEEDSTTTPPTRHCQQGEEAKMWTCVPLLQRVSSSNEITRKTSNDPHVSKIDNKTNCSLDNIDNSDEEIELPSDILEALERQDEGSKPNIEELEIINLADEGEEPRGVKIGTRCTTEQKEALIALLREFHEIFAWSYQDMPGLDTDIVVHKIPLKPECKPVKQALRRMKPEVILKIKEEVEKQLKAGFLSTVTYSDWVANIVLVPKKDGKVRMCVDYRDLNRASPKDNFPLPHIDTLVDNTATNAVFSFMDGFSGYNQIKMAEEDKSKTAFVTHWGTFVYDVMPFGLKNAGATYQRAMVTLFHDMIHHEIEVYVDDMIAKSRTAQDHLTDLRKLFQ